MENRIKECQLDLFADRTSGATMRANQLRSWFASMAYVLLCALRRIALAHTQFAKASCGTIRLKLLKLGALVRTSVRRIKFAMASGCPYQRDFRHRPCATDQCRGALTKQKQPAIICTTVNPNTTPAPAQSRPTVELPGQRLRRRSPLGQRTGSPSSSKTQGIWRSVG
jgi:hypothetical protein